MIRGYRRKIHKIWKERYGTEITEQHLYDQARMIWKNEWITKLELEGISRKLVLKACGSKNKKYWEPWWKRRIKKSINKVRKRINILKSHQSGEIWRGKNMRNLKGSITYRKKE